MCGRNYLQALSKAPYWRLKVRGLILYLLIFSFLITPAQTKQIDSLKKLLPSLSDSGRIDCLNNLSNAYILAEIKDSAIFFANLAYAESRKMNYAQGIGVSLIRKARIIKHFDDNFIEAEKFARQALDWCIKAGDDRMLDEVYFELINVFHAQSHFTEALEIANKRYELAKKNGNETGMIQALLAAAFINKDAGNYEQSFYYLNSFRQLAVKTNDQYSLQVSLFFAGELYMKVEDYPLALTNFTAAMQLETPQFEKARKEADFDIWVKMEYAEIFSHLSQFDSAWHYFELYKPASKDDRYFRIYLVSTGEYFFLLKDYNKALDNFIRGLYLHKRLNDRNEIQRTLIFIAKTYLALDNNSAAVQYAHQGLRLASETKAKQVFRDCYQILYTVYDRWHQTDSANLYFRKYSAMKESVATDQFKAKLAVSHYEKKIELLDKEKQLQNQRLKQTAQQKTFLISSILAIFLLGIIVFRNISLKRKNEEHFRKIAENELKLKKLEIEKSKAEYQKQTSELEMQALRAQMNPHFIFNSLNSINVFIMENNKVKASEYLTKFSRLVRLILQNSLSPLITLEHEIEALRMYLDLEALRFDHHFEYVIDVEEDVDTSGIKVPPLMIQPYVENAIWHGLMHKEEKGKLEIRISNTENVLCCKISDNGIGRKNASEIKSNYASTYKSVGMKITADRIERLQHKNQVRASIKITDIVLPDGTGGGTEVLLKIPLLHD